MTLERVTLLTAVCLTIVTAVLFGWLLRRRTAVSPPSHPPDTRWLRLVVGLIFAAYGQYLLTQSEAAFGPFAWAQVLNNRLRFDLANLDNVVVGVPLLLWGAVMFAGAARFAPWEKADERPLSWAAWSGGLAAEWVTAVFLLGATAVLLLGQDKSWLPVGLWLAALLLLTRQFWLHDRQTGRDISLRLERADKMWLLLLLLIGILIGTAFLQDIPARMIGDEGSFWEAARAIVGGQHKPSLFDLGVYTFPMAGTYWQALVLRLFGLNVWSWRFASVLAGVLAVVPLYVLGREWFGRKTAVIAGLVMLVNPYFLAFARLGYNNSQALLPVTLALAMASLGIRRSSLFYFWLAGLAAGLGFYTYTAARLGVILLLLLGLLLWARRELSWRRCLLLLAVMGGAWAVVVLPYWLFGATNPHKAEPYKFWESLFFNVFYGRAFFSDDELFRFAGPLRIGYQELFFQPFVYFKLLLRGVVRSLLVFNSPFFGGEEHFVATGLSGGMLPGTFMVLGGALAVRGWRRLRFAILLLWFVAGLLFLSVANTLPPRQTHLVALIPAAALFTAVGLVAFTAVLAESLAHNFAAARQTWWRRGVLALCVAGLVVGGLGHYFGGLAARYPANFEQAVAWTAVRLQTSPDVKLVYVETAPQHHDVAYMLWAKMIPLLYENISSTAVLAGETAPLDQEQVLVFIPAEEAPDVVTVVVQIVPNAWPPVALPGGFVVGNTPLPAAPELTWRSAWQSVWDSPARPIVLGLGLLLGLLLIGWLREAWPLRAETGVGDQKADVDEGQSRNHIGFDQEIEAKRRPEK